jgi:2-iminoacetate synthase ThiH
MTTKSEDKIYSGKLMKIGMKKSFEKGYKLAQKEILEKIKKLWKEKCKRMKIMSGDVAIYELNNILDEIKGDKKE